MGIIKLDISDHFPISLIAETLNDSRGKCTNYRHTRIPGLWTLYPGHCTLDAGLWTLHSGHWTLDAGLRTLDPGRWTLLLTVVEQNQNPFSDFA